MLPPSQCPPSPPVGAVARLVDNFEAGSLVLVAPRCSPPEATVASAFSPSLLLAKTVGSLSEAIGESAVSIAFTRREGATRRVHPSLRALLSALPHLADELSGVAGEPSGGGGVGGGGGVALVFGREESGLIDDEVDACSVACAIPTGRVQPSLNLSHAAGLALSAVYDHRLAQAAADDGLQRPARRGFPPATAAQLDLLIGRLAAGFQGAQCSGT